MFSASLGWESLEPHPIDWLGDVVKVWLHDSILVLPGYTCPLWLAPRTPNSYSPLAWLGGPMRHQIVPGNKDSAEITGLEGGVSYSVRVTALVGDREGAPVSIVVTTRRRMLGLEGVLNWGLCSRDGAYGGRVYAGVGEGSRIYSKPVCVGKVWGGNVFSAVGPA